MKATYIKTQIKNVLNISKIVTVHYYEFDKNFLYKGEKHDFWEMVYVDKGKVLVKSEEESITLSQGEIVFHRPNEFHAIRAFDSSPNFFVISFVCNSPIMKYLEKHHGVLDKNLKPFISAIIHESQSTFILPKNDPELKELKKVSSPVIGGEQMIKTYLEQLLILLIRNILKIEKMQVFLNKQSMESHITVSTKKYIENNVDKPFRIADLCASLGYSKSYLSRIFQAQTGDSIYNSMLKEKIKIAKNLIREGNLNFTEISDALSFDNPQYFSRVFRRVTGMSPTEFKNTLDI